MRVLVGMALLLFIIVGTSGCATEQSKEIQGQNQEVRTRNISNMRKPLHSEYLAQEHPYDQRQGKQNSKHQHRQNQQIDQLDQNHQYQQQNHQYQGKSVLQKQHNQLNQPQLKVKGIYVSPGAATHNISSIIQLIEKTDLNAVVVDVKSDTGALTYASNLPLANKMGAVRRGTTPAMKNLIRKLKQHHIYTIGRIVTFKDPFLAAKKHELAMQTKNGKVWRDRSGTSWVDPYLPAVWQYNIGIAREAAAMGFDEIQFDYVRFPDNGDQIDREVRFHNPQNRTKAEIIGAFLQEAERRLHPLGVQVSADVFGLTTTTQNDMGIGQQWGKIAGTVDLISPMIYPSHYSDGTYGIANPDLEPYHMVKRALIDALNKNKQVRQAYGRAAEIRPWLQAFTASWLNPHKSYGVTEIREQIRAAKELGIDQFLLWNSASHYIYK